jgi:Phytanoyl-CoA dioxygenase (PhyH)
MPLDPIRKTRLLREFRLNGFVILRGFLPVSYVEELWEQVLPLLRGEKEKGDRGDSQNKRGANRYSFDLGVYAKLLGGPLADPRYLAHEDIEELVVDILGPRPSWGRGWSRVECAFKGSDHMNWHSDQVEDETPDPQAVNRTVRVTYNIPLVDFTWANGATEFVPGTHLQPRAVLEDPFLDIPNIYSVRPDLRRGDAILRDGNTLHRGAPNLTDVPRAMLDQTYRSSKAGPA